MRSCGLPLVFPNLSSNLMVGPFWRTQIYTQHGPSVDLPSIEKRNTYVSSLDHVWSHRNGYRTSRELVSSLIYEAHTLVTLAQRNSLTSCFSGPFSFPFKTIRPNNPHESHRTSIKWKREWWVWFPLGLPFLVMRKVVVVQGSSRVHPVWHRTTDTWKRRSEGLLIPLRKTDFLTF